MICQIVEAHATASSELLAHLVVAASIGYICLAVWRIRCIKAPEGTIQRIRALAAGPTSSEPICHRHALNVTPDCWVCVKYEHDPTLVAVEAEGGKGYFWRQVGESGAPLPTIRLNRRRQSCHIHSGLQPLMSIIPSPTNAKMPMAASDLH